MRRAVPWEFSLASTSIASMPGLALGSPCHRKGKTQPQSPGPSPQPPLFHRNDTAPKMIEQRLSSFDQPNPLLP